MAATHSNMMPLGTIAPDFNLPNVVTGRHVNLQEIKGEKGTIVMFICNHCPYVIHIKYQLIGIAREYAIKGISSIAINSNDIENYPQDAPDKMKEMMGEWRHPFAAYLFDENQEIAKVYQAACTPDFYVFDASQACIYRGRLDGANPENDIPLSGSDLRNALDNLLAGKSVSDKQIPSIGCNIKWKKE